MPDGPPRDRRSRGQSASSAARSRRRPRWTRDFAVPEGNPERGRDRGQRQVEVVVQDDDGPHLRAPAGRKPRSSWSRSATVDSRAGDRGLVHVDELDVGPVPPEPPRLIDAGTDEQPVEPGVEAIGVAERGQITPGPDERVLHGVLGLFRFPEDEPGGRRPDGRSRRLPARRRRHDRPSAPAPRGLAPSRPSGLARPFGRARVVWRGEGSDSFQIAPAEHRMLVARSGQPGSTRRTTSGPGYDRNPPGHPLTRSTRSREDPRSRREVAARRPGPAGPRLGGRPNAVARPVPPPSRFLADPGNATRKVVIKAQVLVGGRGKAGGVKLASTADEAEDVAAQILGDGDQGPARCAGCSSGRRPRSSRSTTSRSCSTGRPSG